VGVPNVMVRVCLTDEKTSCNHVTPLHAGDPGGLFMHGQNGIGGLKKKDACGVTWCRCLPHTASPTHTTVTRSILRLAHALSC